VASFHQILYHIIFRTKDGRGTIPAENQTELFKYIWGIIKNKNCVLHRINGMQEHLHILIGLHPSIALADLVREIKTSSSNWLKQSEAFPFFNGWASGYCALTYSYKDKDTIVNYIKNQQEHHKEENFENELKRFFVENGLGTGEEFFWADK